MQGQESKQPEEKRNQKRKKYIKTCREKTQGVHIENMHAQSGRGDAQRAHRLDNTINELANYLGAQLRGERRARTHRGKVETGTHSKAEKMMREGARRTRIAQNAARKAAPESYDALLNFWHATHMRRMNIRVVRFFKFCAHTRMKQEAGELE